jgi:hypothetical protein
MVFFPQSTATLFHDHPKYCYFNGFTSLYLCHSGSESTRADNEITKWLYKYRCRNNMHYTNIQRHNLSICPVIGVRNRGCLRTGCEEKI